MLNLKSNAVIAMNKVVRVEDDSNYYTFEYNVFNLPLHGFNKYSGYEEWWEYDGNCNLILYMDSEGLRNEFHENGVMSYHRNYNGEEFRWDEKDRPIYYKDPEGREIEWDSKGREVYYKYSDGRELWTEYDDQKKIVHQKNSNGFERWKNDSICVELNGTKLTIENDGKNNVWERG